MKKVKYSILELASVGQDMEVAQVFKNSLELAQKLEEMGYHRFWLAEHHNMKSFASSATSVLIGHIAEGTKKIRVGSGGIMLPNHSPIIVAEQFGTLAALHPNRIDLGLGRAPGTDQVTAHAIRKDRMHAVHSFPQDIEEIQRYFSKENEHSKLRAIVAEGVQVPIYILGSSTDSAHLAAKKGLPYVFASHFAPAQLMEALSIYHNNFQPSSYLKEPYTIAGINVIAAEDQDEAENISTSLLRLMLGVLTGNLDYMQKPVKMNAELKQLAADPAFQRMLKYAFVGNKEKVKKQTKDFLEKTRINEVIVASHIYHQEDRLESFRIFSEIMNEI